MTGPENRGSDAQGWMGKGGKEGIRTASGGHVAGWRMAGWAQAAASRCMGSDVAFAGDGPWPASPLFRPSPAALWPCAAWILALVPAPMVESCRIWIVSYIGHPFTVAVVASFHSCTVSCGGNFAAAPDPRWDYQQMHNVLSPVAHSSMVITFFSSTEIAPKVYCDV